MTNFEKIMQDPELVKELLAGGLAVKGGCAINCKATFGKGSTPCRYCDFEDVGCTKAREEWLDTEYDEEPKLTKSEKAFLDVIDCVEAYIARDANGDLYVYGGKPLKLTDVYFHNSKPYSSIKENIYGDLFPFIKWEDPEPTSVEYLRTLEVEE